ncbi:SDR family oxidoreductase [Actinobacteria bacterium YIM 96077]|uniref:NAD-dependent dehydratase n=1 Tax=Phytoactinopolyspora halophila TaxID=1981511 RepID=A0A329QGD5_9ACTN|nr:SDR family oxidoreductase [Phytoactinopolyspora halophila]AYY14444.1 SDR family oxidoreductase [Actinobacteria bacterium YIM 96077]RAW11437.1 NAD-dependent dehydratase [Phytoactinopolyspora halophila]
MRVVIAGGHGQIAIRLERLLTLRGDEAIGLVRSHEHAADLAGAGATAVVLDLEYTTADEIAAELHTVDAVVFAAGAGPGSGIPRKDTVDRAGAELLADAAMQAGVRRYILISAMGAGAEPPPDTSEVFAAYLRAKGASEDDLRARPLDWTILRPGRLTDEWGTGRISLATSVPRGPVPRDDVAAVLLALLDEPATAGMTLELVAGDTPIDEAVAAFRNDGTFAP